ncbi:MAG: hypothetical protein NTW16_02070 [Bacteroidetes bacterium]|nr:hypothetical protein [Bacteroidota bacterium]
MKKYIALYSLILLTSVLSYAQVAISTDNAAPDPSAMLEVKSTTKGLLAPQMTFAERNAIVTPATGLVVICTNCSTDGTGVVSIYLGGKWLNLNDSCDVPVAPAEGVHVQSNTQIIWNWSTVPIATGYKWHTSNNFASATDMGAATTKTETGRTQGTNYTRYVWAYNACGYSEPVILNGQALSCGSAFTRAHTADTVAPVSKTVTYGTVTNIPGETTKCWITRNLGASQQPNTVDDNTEASAGWYWQFNRMQGYKHDGTTRTPNSTWITPISEDSDWESANDPCSLLLGSAWRIPTLTEWTNVDATGNWINMNGPFSSGLQMHAAGFLNFPDGSPGFRGSGGYYWSSSQFDALIAWCLSFNSGTSFMNNFGSKAYGFSTRCVRE